MSTETMEQAPPIKWVWVELTAAHTHRGDSFPPGTRLELREDQARRLTEAGCAVASSKPAKGGIGRQHQGS